MVTEAISVGESGAVDACTRSYVVRVDKMLLSTYCQWFEGGGHI